MARFNHQWIESCVKDYANKNLGNVTQILNEYLDKEVGDHYYGRLFCEREIPLQTGTQEVFV